MAVCPLDPDPWMNIFLRIRILSTDLKEISLQYLFCLVPWAGVLLHIVLDEQGERIRESRTILIQSFNLSTQLQLRLLSKFSNEGWTIFI